MRRLVVTAVALVAAGLTPAVRADDKPNPTGTWKWEVSRGGESRAMTLKLKLDGDKLTGAMVGRDGQETAIEDGAYKDGEVSFKITRERNGQKMTTRYHGKLEGGSIKGKIDMERNGEPVSRDWTAKREKD